MTRAASLSTQRRRPALFRIGAGKPGRNIGAALFYVVLLAVAAAMIYPYAWMVVNSLKGAQGFIADPYSLIPRKFSFESLIFVWGGGKIALYLKNSLVYAAIVLTVQTMINSMAAYAFARVEFPGRGVLFLAVLATMMLPYSVLLIPTYLIVWRLGLANTVAGVVLPGFASAYGIYMLRQFFLSIPRDLEDAARIDGCGYFRVYWQVILPLAQPAIVTMAMFTFIGEWSNFTWPLVVLSDFKKYPITVGISLFHDQNYLFWDRTFAACLFATIPVIILFALGQRYIVGGISLTGLKG